MMKNVFRALLCLLISGAVCLPSLAQVYNGRVHTPEDPPELPEIPAIEPESLIVPDFRRNLLLPPIFFTNETRKMLYSAISSKLGIRYRFFGTDENGFDCSGFVWRVFQDAGASFDRVAARTLWHQFPEATDEEKIKFGTLVFFNGLRHVGIVRDAFSFYHASRSQGVTLSYFDGYWGKRLTGFRRAPISFESVINSD